MIYDITKPTAPAMPNLGKGLELPKLLFSQVSKDMQEAIAPLIFDSLASHISGTEFMYPDLTWKEICGLITAIVARSAGGKGQLQRLVEAIMRGARQHDELQLQKLVEWQKTVKSKGANKEKPVRPEVSFWFPPSDVTNAAVIQKSGCQTNDLHLELINVFVLRGINDNAFFNAVCIVLIAQRRAVQKRIVFEPIPSNRW